MFSFDFTKFLFFATVTFAFLSAAGCRAGKPAETGDVPIGELKSNVPFSNREPEVYQAEMVVRTDAGERISFVAKNGSRRRTEFSRGNRGNIVLIETDRLRSLLPARKIFTELDLRASGATDDFGDFLTTEWLSDARFATFEKVGVEEGLTKYKVTVDGASEIENFVFVDDVNALLVRQEQYAVEDGVRKLFHSFELRGFRTDAEESLFQIPASFRRVSSEEFTNAVREIDNENE